MQISGLYTALITPFTERGSVDEEGLRQNIRRQLQHQVQGIVVLGSTGETPTLTLEEQKRIIAIAREEVKLPTLLMVGTGSYSTQQTVINTLLATEMGANSVMIVTPYYNKPTQEGLYQHFAKICEKTSLPICIYNNQGRTGQNLQTDTLQRLVQLPSIIAVKEASGNIIQMNEILYMRDKERPDFSIVSGDDIMTLPLFSLGGNGVISVVSNLLPKACMQGDFALARKWHYQLLPFYQIAFVETNPIPIKAAMQLCQMAAGTCRLPLCDLTPTNLHKLKEVIQTIPPAWLY
jgi:4-hydroxy-tetrahydrodipicolinate synthase